MSRPVDEKIVKLKLDNSDFKKNATASVGMFSKLQNALGKVKNIDMRKSIDSLGNLKKMGDNITLDSLGKSVENVSFKFSGLAVMAVTALTNITNKAVNAGIAMAQSFTSDPIMAGFKEYELKTKSMMTIMTNTGESVDVVNAKLNELNTYSDKTIYSFNDMTNAIGSLSTSGMKLNDASDAVMGFYNLAAGTGVEAARAGSLLETAMVQAIQIGKMDYQNWKQLQQAGMGGPKFKDALIANAKAMGKNVDLSEGFNESLKDGWATTDVMLATLKQFKDDESLLDAATKVRTFSQMMDTAKEALESGWAQTWEIIFGDFDEATEMWSGLSDVVNGFISGMSEGRNALLQNIKDLGGRDKAIQAIVNVYKALMNIIEPVYKAFRKMFPPSDGKAIYYIISAIELLTRALEWLTRGVGTVLGGVFTVFFGILRGGVEIVKFLGRVIAFLIPDNLVEKVTFLGDKFNALGKILGNFIDSIIESKEVQLLISEMSAGLMEFANWAKKGLGQAADAFVKFSAIAVDEIIAFLPILREGLLDGSKWLANFTTNAIRFIRNFSKDAGKWFNNLWGDAKELFGDLVEFLKEFAEGASKAGKQFKVNFGGVFEFIGAVAKTAWDIIKQIRLDDILKVFTIGGIVIFGKKIIEILDAVKESIGGLFGKGDASPSNVLTNLTDSLKNMSDSINVGSIISIAVSIGILVLAIKLLEGMKSEDISKGLATIVLGLAAMVKALKSINGMDLGFKDAIITVGLVGALAGAVLILAGALKILESIDADKMGTALAGLVGILLSLTMSLNSMSKNQGKIAASAAFVVGLSIAIRIMVGAIKSMGTMDVASLAKGVGSLGVILLELAVFMRLANGTRIRPSSAVGLVITTGAIKMMVSSITDIADIKAGDLVKGLVTLGVILGELAVFTRLVNGAKALSASVGMVAIAFAIGKLVDPINELGNTDMGVLAVGLGALGIALGAIALSMRLAGGASSGIGILAVALALNILVPPLKAMGQMSLKELGMGLLGLAGAFVIIGGTAYLMGAASVSMLAFGAGLALLGASVALVGIGLAAFASGLVVLAGISVVSIKGIINTMDALLEGAASLLPRVVELFITMLETIIGSIADALPGILDSGFRIVIALLEGIGKNIYKVVDLFVDLVVQLANAIGDNAEPLLKAGVQLITDLINGLADTLRDDGPKLVKSVLGIVEAILEIVVLALLEVVRILFDWIPGVSGAVDQMGTDATNALRSAFDIGPVGGERADEFVKGVQSKEGKAEAAGANLGKKTKDGAGSDRAGMGRTGGGNADEYNKGVNSKRGASNREGTGLANETKKGAGGVSLKGTGTTVGQTYSDGIANKKELAYSTSRSMANRGKDGANSVSFESAGRNAGEGFALGLSYKTTRVSNAAGALASAANGSLRSNLRIQSPSRVTMEAGGFFGEGFVIGIKDKTKDALSVISANITTIRSQVLTADAVTSTHIKSDTDERYKVVTERIADLVKIREDLKGRKVEGLKMDTIVNGVISIAGIVLVMKHEKLDIITSKAFGIATKLIGR